MTLSRSCKTHYKQIFAVLILLGMPVMGYSLTYVARATGPTFYESAALECTKTHGCFSEEVAIQEYIDWRSSNGVHVVSFMVKEPRSWVGLSSGTYLKADLPEVVNYPTYKTRYEEKYCYSWTASCSGKHISTGVHDIYEHTPIGCDRGYEPVWVGFNGDFYKCVRVEDKIEHRNKGKGCPSVGNPVNPLTGNKYQKEIDYNGTVYNTLKFARYFNLEKLEQSIFQFGWSHTYRRKLVYRESNTSGVQDVVTLRRPDGKTKYFILSSSNWVSAFPDEKYGSLVEGTNGWIYINTKDEIEEYDLGGKLLSITKRSGVVETISYNGDGFINTVTDTHGNILKFNYGEAGKLGSIDTPNGESVLYSYDQNRNLSEVTKADTQATVKYRYEDASFPHALTGITDESGQRYATWTYDSEGRAVTSQHGGGAGYTSIDYSAIDSVSDPRVTVTNALGKATTYHYTTINGIRKLKQVEGHPTSSCAGSIKGYTYNTNGLLASTTDWDGVKTTYVYNSRGLETSRTEAIGTSEERTITTKWHADFRLPSKITTPDTITEYVYDSSGQLVSKKTTDNSNNP